MKNTITIFFSALFFLLPSYAQANEKEYANAAIIVDEKNNAGLDVELADGWYTYWRMAGDNGLPPKFDWTGSQNVKDVAVQWPVPSRFTLMDMHSFGYKDNVVFPLVITPEDAAKDVVLSLKLDLVVCHEICVPQTVTLTQALKDARVDSKAVEEARKRLPLTEDTKTLGLGTAVLGKDALVLTAFSADGFATGADIIVETPVPLLTGPPEIIPDETDNMRAVLKIKAPAGLDLGKELFGKEATVLLIHRGQAIEEKFSF